MKIAHRLLRSVGSLILPLLAASSLFAVGGVGGTGSTIQYNPTGYIAQGVLAPNGGTYPNDSYQLLITGPTDANATNPVTVTLGFTVLNAPAGINAATFVSASPQTITFNVSNQVIPVAISVVVPSSVGGASTAGSYGWRVKPVSWPTAANVVGDPGATINGLATDAPAQPAPPVITNLLPANGSFFIYNGTPITFPISFNATATGTGSIALISGLSASVDGSLLNGTVQNGVTLPTLAVTGLSSLNASGSVTSPGITSSGPHTITVSATNGAGTATATTQINILTPPTITNTNNPAFVYGKAGTTFTVTATGFPAPTFSATGLPAWATINPTTGVIGGTPTSTGTTTFMVTAANVFNGTNVGSATKTFTLTVGTAPLTVTANAASKNFGAADPATLTYTLSGALFGTDTLNGALARVAGENVGTYAINQGTLAANANYTLTYAGALFTINQAPQVITFGAIPTKTLGTAPFALTATGGDSNNPITYTSSNTAVATVSGSTVTIISAGTSLITANQAGNTNYGAAAPVSQTLTVTGKLNQTIAFGALASRQVGSAPFALTATASSGLTVTYTSSNAAVATVTGSTVTILTAGTTVITANQSGNATYNAAAPVSQTLTVTAAPTCITSILWLPPVSYNWCLWGGSYVPIKFTLQQCCSTTTSSNEQRDGCGDDRDDDGAWDWNHWGHNDDHVGSYVTCHHGSSGKSTEDVNCRHDSDHQYDENHDGCVSLRDKSVVISVYEVGSTALATQYKYGTGSPNPPDYIIDGDCKYQLNFPIARGSHRYHVDVYRYPAGSSTPVLVGSKEVSTWTW